MAKLIPLTQGQFATVDDEDFEYLNQWKWHATWNACTQSFYARRNETVGKKKQKSVRMHTQLTGYRITDHIDSNTLNNQRQNLREATSLQNSRNRRLYKNNTTGLKGVSFNKRRNKYSATIRINKKLLVLGFYEDPKDAYVAYCAAAHEHFGEFANVG